MNSSRISTFSVGVGQRQGRSVDHGGGVSGGGFAEIHLDDVGDIGQGFPRIVHPKVVQRYRVADSSRRRQAASPDHRRNGFQSLEYGLFQWQKIDVILDENVASDFFDEGSRPSQRTSRPSNIAVSKVLREVASAFV